MNRTDKNRYRDIIFPIDAPICPHCGGKMGWDDDMQLSEIGYVESIENRLQRGVPYEEIEPLLDKDGELKEDAISKIFSCPQCQCSAEYMDLEDGEMILLSYCTGDEDEPDVEYSQYAQDRFEMPPYIG